MGVSGRLVQGVVLRHPSRVEETARPLYVGRQIGHILACVFFREFSMSNLFTFLLVLQAIVAAAMIGVILMQKSEGGGLGVGGSPAGLLSARGAADFLTRATTILATAFVGLSIILAAMASVGGSGGSSTLDTSLTKTAQPAGGAAAGGLSAPAQAPAGAAPAPAQAAPASDDPLAAARAAAAAGDPAAPPQGSSAPTKK